MIKLVSAKSLILIKPGLELILLRHASELLLLSSISWHCCAELLMLLLLWHTTTLIIVGIGHLILNTLCHCIVDLLLLRLHLAHKYRIRHEFRFFRSCLLLRSWLLLLRGIIIPEWVEWCTLIISACRCTSKIKSFSYVLISILSILGSCCSKGSVVSTSSEKI